MIRNYIESGLRLVTTGLVLSGCAAEAAPPPPPIINKPSLAEQDTQHAKIAWCTNQIQDLTGIRFKTVIIGQESLILRNGIAGTSEIKNIKASTLDYIVKSVHDLSKAGICHEVKHVFQNVRARIRPPSPLLQRSSYLEAEANTTAAILNPEFEQDYMRMQAIGQNMVATPQTAIPDVYNFKPGINMSQKENENFKQGTQAMLYKMGMLNYFNYLRQAYKNDLINGFKKLQSQLSYRPDQTLEILKKEAGYKTDQEFYTDHPFFGPIAPGPRVFTMYQGDGILLVYYFTVLPDGTIQPLSGNLYYKTVDGNHSGQTKIKGIIPIQLNDLFKGMTKVYIGPEGTPGSLTDYININD
ncbi:hypothetical protein HYW54_04855 [Candidatus Gottesmanbacteria bacterium]|nr:hypothetical protein [Candidatus Gottesmanbacteria bacterium]